MSTKKLLLAGCLSMLVTFAAGFGWQAAAATAEHPCYFVRIEAPPATGAPLARRSLSPVAPRFSINPPGLRVRPNTCITWVNWSRVAQVQIKFVKGLQCRAAITGACGFRLSPKNCFTTSHLRYGCTSSLVFTKTGVYDYVVETKSEGILTGRITVVK